MAQDKRGRPTEPDMDEALNELQAEEGGQDFVAGPTQRNEVGNTKRAAAKATGIMGASKKLDPDLDIGHVDDGRVTSGSPAGIRSFSEVPPEKGATEASLTLSNEEIAENALTAARKSPAGGRSQSFTGEEKPQKPVAQGDGPQGQRPLSKGGGEER